jgi:hypothetical protein
MVIVLTKVACLQARQQLTKCIREGRTALLDGNGALAVMKSEKCASLAEDMKDVRAIRAVSRLKASALRQVGSSPPFPFLVSFAYVQQANSSDDL